MKRTVLRPMISMHYCSLQFLNFWLEHEQRYVALFPDVAWGQSHDRVDLALKAAAYFKVSRNISEKFAPGKRRRKIFEELLALLDGVRRSEVEEGLTETVCRLHQSAFQIVGRNVLSLVTKFLWLKEKSPVRIYDSLARTALEVPEVDNKGDQYRRFCDAWSLEYSKAEQMIRRACQDLETVGPFSCDPEAATSHYLRDLTTQTWFQHRVFDVYLWRKGGLQKAT